MTQEPMNKHYIYPVLFAILLALPRLLSAQCACTNCPQDLPDNTNQDFYINVEDSGGGNCDLASNPLMGVNLYFTHEYLGDLTMTLTAPNGQTIELIGESGYHGVTHHMCGLLDQFECADTFNINFMDGVGTAWSSVEVSATATADNNGLFEPSDGGLLSSFTGDACGTWIINVDDAQAHDIGEFISFGLDFQSNFDIDCNSNDPLPIELVNFEGKHIADQVVLNWETLTETNNRFFSIERSLDGLDFEKIGRVEGSGTSFEPRRYFFVDQRPLLQHAYYRLIQEDFDGQRSSSALIYLKSEKATFLAEPVRIVPSLVVGPAMLVLGSDANETALVSILDLNGKLVWQEQVVLAPGGNYFERDFSALPRGLYMVSLQSGRGTNAFRFMKK